MGRASRRVILRSASAAVLLGVLLSSHWFGAVVVASGSMRPALEVGDVVVYRRGADARVDDIVLYDKSGWPAGVVHRVTRVLPSGAYQTRGDANPIPDLMPVSPPSVKGRCVLVVPFGSLFRQWSG